MTGPSSARGKGPLAAVAFMCAAMALFCAMDALAKVLVRELPPFVAVWGRYGGALVPLLLLMPFLGWRRFLATRQPWLQSLRGATLVGCTIMFFTGLRYLPLADAYAISFVSPLFVAAMAALVLREHVGAARWAAIVVGLLGVLVIIRPAGLLGGAGTGFGWAAAYPLGMAFLFAAYQIMTRLLGSTDGPLVILFIGVAAGTAITSAVVPFVWVPLAPGHFLAFLGLGGIGLAAHWCLIQAFARAEAAHLAPFIYTQILWAVLIGVVVFGDLPDAPTLVGAAIVTACGIAVARLKG